MCHASRKKRDIPNLGTFDGPFIGKRLTNMARHNIDEKPGRGRYCCANCNWSVYLDEDSDRLPPCGNCGAGQNTVYYDC